MRRDCQIPPCWNFPFCQRRAIAGLKDSNFTLILPLDDITHI